MGDDMYTFRLDPVLRKEQYIEEQLQKDLATTAKKVEEEQHLLEVIGEEKESYSLELERKKSKKMRVGEMELFDCFFNALSVEEGLQNGKVQDARERFEGTRNRLVKVMQKRKSLESLKRKGRSQLPDRFAQETGSVSG